MSESEAAEYIRSCHARQQEMRRVVCRSIGLRFADELLKMVESHDTVNGYPQEATSA